MKLLNPYLSVSRVSQYGLHAVSASPEDTLPSESIYQHYFYSPGHSLVNSDLSLLSFHFESLDQDKRIRFRMSESQMPLTTLRALS